MIALTLEDIASAMNGQILHSSGGVIVSGHAQTDSRLVQPGDIFFARLGEHTDGHLFADQAIANGAALLVVEREIEQSQGASDRSTINQVPLILVQDATIALGQLAAVSVARLKSAHHLRVVGITGSVGKTSTKNFVASLAELIGNTVASEKSFNNEVGGPITMLRADADTSILVAEMGASEEGDIAKLVTMAPPDIAVVLAVGLAHVGKFGGIETTFRAKSEMVQGLPADAVAVLNADDPWVRKMAELTSARVVWFGQTVSADVRATELDSSSSGTSFLLHAGGQSRQVTFRVLGEHHVQNALAAAAVGIELGLTLDQVVQVLEAATIAAPGRMQPMPCRDAITIINDAYNANPDSMSAALKTLAQLKTPGSRTVAVLGPMSELGEISGEQHDRIGLLVVRLGIDELIVIGAEARRLHISAINEGSWDGESVFFEDHDSALAYLVNTLKPADTVLVKASNAAGLQGFADQLAGVLA